MPFSRIPSAAAEELPPPSAELDIIAALTHAYLQSIPPSRRMAFLESVECHLQHHEALSKVTNIRPVSQDADKARARRQAYAWMSMAKGMYEALERGRRISAARSRR